MSLLQRLLRRLDLQQSTKDCYLGGAGEGGVTANARLFGGLVAAQAAMAASLNVDNLPMHSLHAYFLRPGRAHKPIEFRVTTIKQGRNFQVRSVEAWQNEQQIFQLMASFQKPEKGVHHQTDMPRVPAPEELPNRDELRGRSHWQDMPIDVRMASQITRAQALPPRQQIWLKVNGTLPPDPNIHLAMMVYASDRCLLDTAWRPHADQGNLVGASLDHSMWFHQPAQFDHWLLYDMHSPAAGAGRGLAFGALYNQRGERVVSTTQEGVLRVG